MSNYYQRNIWPQVLILIALTVLIWVSAWLRMPAIDYDICGPLYFLLSLDNIPPKIATILALVIVIGEGILFNTILYNKRIVKQRDLTPLLMYIVAMGIGSGGLTLSPIFFANLFLIIAIGQQMSENSTYSINESNLLIAATCIAIATMFYPPTVLFLLPMIINMLGYRLYPGRYWLMLLLGFAAPFITLELVLFVTDGIFYQNMLMLYSLTDWDIVAHGNAAGWLSSLLFLILLLAGVIASRGQSSYLSKNITKNIEVAMVTLIAAIPLLAYQQIIPIASNCLALPFTLAGTSLIHNVQKGLSMVWVILAFAVIIICNFFL